MAQTRLALTTTARTLTAERGLHGFTVDELCDRVGVSRRTFFNYFDAKEQAIIGHPAEWFIEDAVDFFVAMRPRGAGVSASLLDDLVALETAHISAIGLTPDDARGFIAAIQREPQLLPRLMEAGALRESRLIEMVARREGIETSDPIASAAVLIVGALVRASAEVFFTPDNDQPFDAIIAIRLDAAKALFAAAANRTPTRGNE